MICSVMIVMWGLAFIDQASSTLGRRNHRSVLNILDSLLANQIPAKGVVTIVCRIEIRKMAEC